MHAVGSHLRTRVPEVRSGVSFSSQLAKRTLSQCTSSTEIELMRPLRRRDEYGQIPIAKNVPNDRARLVLPSSEHSNNVCVAGPHRVSGILRLLRIDDPPLQNLDCPVIVHEERMTQRGDIENGNTVNEEFFSADRCSAAIATRRGQSGAQRHKLLISAALRVLSAKMSVPGCAMDIAHADAVGERRSLVTENDKLRDYDKVKHNTMPDIPIDGPTGNALKTYDAMMKNVVTSITFPGLSDIASKYTSSMLAKSLAPTQSIISASLAQSMAVPQSIISASLAKSLAGPQSIIAAALGNNFAGSQGAVAAAMAKGLGSQGSVASMLANMDSVMKSVESSQRQISKNSALMDALETPLYQPTPSPSPALIKAMTIPVRVDPTPGLIRETNEVMRQILATDQQVVDANMKLLQRDIEREERNERIERRNSRLTVLSVALAGALLLLTVYSLLPH